MKRICFPLLLILISFVSSSQTDSLWSKPVITVKYNPVLTQQVKGQLTKLSDQLTKLETVLKNLTDQLDKMKDSRDSLSELGEEQQLRMQMIMDRMTKADSAASNALKKYSEICSQIIGNWK